MGSIRRQLLGALVIKAVAAADQLLTVAVVLVVTATVLFIGKRGKQ
jgi:hypothetical protein